MGFDKFDDLDSKSKEAFRTIQKQELEELVSLQFMLVYKGNLSKSEVDNMSPFELKYWFSLLKKQIELEYESKAEKRWQTLNGRTTKTKENKIT